MLVEFLPLVYGVRRLALAALLIIAACEPSQDAESIAPADADLSIPRRPLEPGTIEITLDAQRGYPNGPLLETTEQVRIGAVSGAPELEFHQLRTIQVDDAGFIYVGNDRAGEIRVFAPDGAFVRKIGQYGEGPEEFRSIRTMFFQGDVLVVEDATNGRINRIAPDGTFIGTLKQSPAGKILSPRGARSEGYIVMTSRRSNRAWILGEVYRLAFLLAYVPGVEAYDSAAVDLGNPPSILELSTPRDFTVDGGIGLMGARPLWEPVAEVAVDGAARVYAHLGNAYIIDTFDHTGRLLRRITAKHTPRPVDHALVQEYANRASARIRKNPSTNPEEAATAPSLITGRAKLPTPENLPVLGKLLVSRNGTLWVERPDLVDDPVTLEVGSSPSRWDVITAAGELLGTVEFPETFTPMVAMDRGVIGVDKDGLGVEYVVRRALAK